MTSSDCGQLKIVCLHCKNLTSRYEKSMKTDTLDPYVTMLENRTLILCESEHSCDFASVTLRARHVDTCFLTSELFEEHPEFAKNDLATFLKGDGRIGVTTFKLFEDRTVPLVENIVFYDYPENMADFNALITRIASESNVCHVGADVNVTCIVSNSMDYDTVKAVVTEQKMRGNQVPEWLQAKVRDMEQRRKAEEETRIARPLGDGTFLVPARCITGHDDDEDEDKDEDYDEREYDYDGHFQTDG